MDGKSILKLLDTEQLVNRFHLKKKMRVWRASFLVERGKLLHKRDSDKVDAQEESFLPKHQSVKELRQRAEQLGTTCEQLEQKWQCVEDATGSLSYTSARSPQGLGEESCPTWCPSTADRMAGLVPVTSGTINAAHPDTGRSSSRRSTAIAVWLHPLSGHRDGEQGTPYRSG